jgi:alkylhydroperoxidase family enzyme
MSTGIISEHGALPLAPYDHPKNPFIRLMIGAGRRRYGKAPMAFRVLYPRFAWLALASAVLYALLEYATRIGVELAGLLQASTSLRAGCTFCSDIVIAEGIRRRIGRERFGALLDFESSPLFTEREKAALAYTSAIAESLHVSDAVWQRLALHFSERERVEIVWVCAVERYFNSMALPLRIGSDHLSERAEPRR